MKSEHIEEMVARAICKAKSVDPDTRYSAKLVAWQTHLPEARAAIGAIAALTAVKDPHKLTEAEMSESKHTPGPWGVSNGNLLRVAKSISGQAMTICGVHKIGKLGGHAVGDPLANARLIAAAPDLLAALKALDAYWLEDFPEGPSEPENTTDQLVKVLNGRLADDTIAIWKAARAAIAVAEGRQAAHNLDQGEA